MAASRPQESRYFPSALDIKDNTQQTVLLSTSGAQSTSLGVGIYAVDSDVACFIKVGSPASDVTAANGFPLYANTQLLLLVRENDRIGGIVAGGTGTLRYHKVG